MTVAASMPGVVPALDVALGAPVVRVRLGEVAVGGE